MFEGRVLVDGLDCLGLGLLGAVKEKLKLHVVDGVASLVSYHLRFIGHENKMRCA